MIEELKIAFFLALVYFLLASKIFNVYILKKIPGALEYDMITERGAMVSALFMAVAFLIIHFLVMEELI